MIFLTDTCFWSHVQVLYQETSIDLRENIKQYHWGFSRKVEQEIVHYKLNQFIPFHDAHIIPISAIEWHQFKLKYSFLEELDIQDQSLLLIALRDRCHILTDDGSLYIEAKALHLSCFLLPLFMLNQVCSGFLSKREFNRSLRFWESKHLYALRDIKKWKSALNKF